MALKIIRKLDIHHNQQLSHPNVAMTEGWTNSWKNHSNPIQLLRNGDVVLYSTKQNEP